MAVEVPADCVFTGMMFWTMVLVTTNLYGDGLSSVEVWLINLLRTAFCGLGQYYGR